jgi:hypothetical protein
VLLTVIGDVLTIVAHLEERGLGGIQASVARGDNDINWSNQPNTSRSTNLVLGHLLADLLEVSLGEDEADVADEQVHERVEGVVPSLVSVGLDAAPDERVLPHEHHGVAPQPAADVLELLGADVVGEGDEHLGVLIEQAAQLAVVRLLLFRLGPLDRHRCRGNVTLARGGGGSVGWRYTEEDQAFKEAEGQGGRLAAAASL